MAKIILMEPFSFFKAKDDQTAIKTLSEEKKGRYLAGSTNLVDLMRRHVETPSLLVDINDLNLKKIEFTGNKLRIGALVTNSDLAYHKDVVKYFPVLSQAILSGASPQIRNMATTGGNILQRTRCPYFYDTAFPCNKREPGSGCSAINGYNRMHAVLGTSDQCIATHPSDMCVAMIALDAVIRVRGESGSRDILFKDFHLEPGNAPDKENVLKHGELIEAVEIPSLPFAKKSAYIKVRDRTSFEFALASAAVALDINNGMIKSARIGMGGIATKPWRAEKAEQVLAGKKFDEKILEEAATTEMSEAKPHKHNEFKIALAKRTLVRALKKVGGLHE